MITVAPAPHALPDLSASTSSVASDAPSSASYGSWGDSSTSSLAAQARAAASALLVSQEDVILGSGWDYDAPATPRFAPHKATGGAASPSSGTDSPRSLDEGRIPAQEKHSDGSRSPSPGVSPMGGSGLLIRSTKQGWDRSFEVHHDWPAPAVRKADEVLIRNVTAGLNPVDFQSILYNFGIPDTPWVLGRDVMGIVEEVGSDVTEFAPGQRVWTCADSRDVRAGAYQSRSVSRSVHLSHLPDNITDDAGATLGTGLVTAAVCAFWFFDLPRAQSLGGGLINKTGREGASSVAVAGEEADWILVYGGGAVTGQFIAQLAKLAGLKVAVVASPSNFEHLSSDLVGAHACVDRFLSADKLLEEVKRVTGGKLRYAMDCVGSSTANICEAALRSTGAEGTQLICLAGNPKAQPGAAPKEGPAVKVHKISFSTTIYGDDVFAKALFGDLAVLLERNELKPVRAHVIPDGLAGVRRGLESLRDGTAPSAKKLVVRIKDTPHAHFTNLGVRAEMCWNGVV